ncbi:MAG: DUF1800 domain-containing protein [Bacteroidota bacterium]
MRLLAVLLAFVLTSAACAQQPGDSSVSEVDGEERVDPATMQASRMPYIVAGLTEREAAAHLLNRFAYGPRPGEVEAVVAQGFDAWFAAQLDPGPDPADLTARMDGFYALAGTPEDLARMYRRNGQIMREARNRGLIGDDVTANSPEGRAAIRQVRDEMGYRNGAEIFRDLMHYKLTRAIYSPYQLQEVLTDFWYNHFNVELAPDVAFFVRDFEETAIRPHVTGRFEAMLRATARHPAMLLYLDNALSVAPPGMRTEAPRPRRIPGGLTGINENYARELMELHTLGVDGGYTQADIEEVSRAFTGWTVVPVSRFQAATVNERGRQQLDRFVTGRGVVRDGFFLYVPNFHDAEAKTILGEAFPAGRGIDEGERILGMLAAHPSTAQHIARKLAVKFVQDDPDAVLVERLAGVFTETEGDLKAMLWAIAEAPEFWALPALEGKVKTPLEYVASALRATDAEVLRPGVLATALRTMGEAPYRAPAPTGYDEASEAWINTGSLLARMDFGLRLAQDTFRDVEIDLAALNQNRQPESAEAALETYARLLLPGRDLDETIARLSPLIANPEFAARVRDAAPEARPDMVDGERLDTDDPPRTRRAPTMRPDDTLALVVGVILGSPEFQRQ